MPHLTLEYTSNLSEKGDFRFLFRAFHYLLTEILSTELGTCKSRAVCFDDYYVGGGEDNAFVHVNLGILSGRSEEQLKTISRSIVLVLKKHFNDFIVRKKINLQISIEIRELKNYFKYTDINNLLF